MPSFNHVVVVGHLTRDPELRFIPSGAAVCEFSVAVNRKWKDKNGEMKEEVSFLDCQAWARTAELVAEYMKKGRALLVAGYLKQERWTDKETGTGRSRVRIVAERVQFLGPNREEGGGSGEAPPPPEETPDEIPF